MPFKHTCPTCTKAFEGRRNKVYCSPECKNEFSNKREFELKETVKKDYNTMLNNARILQALIKTKPNDKKIVFKSELEALGFDLSGPFKVRKTILNYTLVIGGYVLEDKGFWFEYYENRSFLFGK